jgi:SAM-dependent methyltransferase
VVIGGKLGYALLKRISPGTGHGDNDVDPYEGRSKLEVLLGDSVWDQTRGKKVIDFGCGRGEVAVEVAVRGAGHVTGVDIRSSVLDAARKLAEREGVADRCAFTTDPKEPADVILSIDSFEHFEDPSFILCRIDELLKPGGRVLISFGPTWYHPYGGHLFSVFPWAHLLFTERALIRWRSDFKSDGATRFGEVSGGLNQMTIARFEKTVRASTFEFEAFDPVPIRAVRSLHNRMTREFFSSIVRCQLKRKADRVS